MPLNDPINHPPHYTFGSIEVIDAIEDWELTYHEGNIIKYVARWRRKGGIADLKKAQWYLARLIANEETATNAIVVEETCCDAPKYMRDGKLWCLNALCPDSYWRQSEKT